jgi:tRNA dimethylallyltransferase
MLLCILGPTASGKTALAARLACECNGEVISADSRQVYRGMDIGTGKDLGDYTVDGNRVPVHLIDIVEPGYEYNIYEFQQDFLKVYYDILGRNKLPVLCGGSGMYLETVLKGYRLAAAPADDEILKSLQDKSDADLTELLQSFKTLHNITDLEDRPRLLKAILVAQKSKIAEESHANTGFPEIESMIFGISYPRELLKLRITERLENRLNIGMITEVEELLRKGISPERLMKYGLEYKFITLFLTGKISRADLFIELNIAIRQFAKRQMTWFRRMERQGMNIHWIDGRAPLEQKMKEIRFLAGI